MSWNRYSQKNIKGEVKLYLQKMLVKTTHDKLENIKANTNPFLVKLCKLIKQGSILVNVDKVFFSPSTIINYSCNRGGMTSNRSTTLFSEFVSIVSSFYQMEPALQVSELGPLNPTYLSSILSTLLMFERDWVWILIKYVVSWTILLSIK